MEHRHLHKKYIKFYQRRQGAQSAKTSDSDMKIDATTRIKAASKNESGTTQTQYQQYLSCY